MMLKTTILLLAYYMISISRSETVYYIEPHTNSSDCLGTLHCDTLTNYISRKNGSNVETLYFLPGNHTLSVTLSFSGMKTLSLIARHEGKVLIQCSEQARVLFEYVSTLTIEGIQFIGCGVVNSQPAVELDHCYGSVSNVRVGDSPFGAVYIHNSTLSFINLTIDHNKLNYTKESFSAIKVVLSDIKLTGTTTISENNAFSDQNIEMECGSGAYKYKDYKSITFKIVNTTLSVNGYLIITKNIAPSGTMNFENSNFQMTGTSLFSENTVCVHGALSFENSNASLSNSTHFINNTASIYYYPGLIPVAGISLRLSRLHVEGITAFKGNKGDISAIEAYTSYISISGKLFDEHNSATYTTIILRSETDMVVDGEAVFTNSNNGDAILRAESSNFTSNGKVSFTNSKGFAPCVARYSGHYCFNGITTFENNSGIFDAFFRCSVSFKGNSTFITNNAKDFSIGGGIVMSQSVLYLAGNYSFERNRLTDVDGGAIYADQSRIEFEGHGRFVRNAARNGGAIYLQNNSTILLQPGVKIDLIGNSATKGGAFFIFSSIYSFNCENPLPTEGSICLIQHHHTVIDDNAITFKENSATKGGSIMHIKFVEEIDIVEHNISTSALESLKEHSSDSNTSPLIVTDSFRLCFCEHNMPICDSSVKQFKQIIRGQRIVVSIAAVTLVQNNYMYVRSYLSSMNSSPSSIKSLDGDIQYLREGCTDLKYRVFSNSSEEHVIICADESCEEASDEKLLLQVQFEGCPLGFVSDGMRCVCDQTILKGATEVCNIDRKSMRKTSRNFWIGSQNGHLYFFTRCPFDYCTPPPIDVNPSMPDTQCRNNRSGILCGACRENMSLIFGSSKCKECSNNLGLFLIIPFALLGILLVTFLFTFQLTVSSGTIHGLILYANIVKANSAILHLQNIKGLTVFIAWFNLDFGIETCFHKGMDQLSRTGWQFVFPIYLWLLVGLVIVICHYSVRASRFFSTSNPVEVLATVILLSYTKLLQNIISILSATIPDYPLHSNSPVWLYDGNVIYGQGTHAVLITVGILILVFLFIPYTFILLFAQLLQKNRHVSKFFDRLRLTLFIKAYQAPFKSGSRYWLGLCLFLRCLLLVAVGTGGNKNIGLLVTSSLCVLLLSIAGMTGGIYSKGWINVLEISYILNIGLLAAAAYHLKTNYPPNESRIGEQIVGYISITVSIITFIATIIKQSYSRLRKLPRFKRGIEALHEKVRKKETLVNGMDSPNIEVSRSPRKSSATFQELVLISDDHDTLAELREPMLEYTQ